MGVLRDGTWHTGWIDTKSTGGKFEREQSTFRNWVTADGAPGPTGEGGFAAETGRYHLYASYACPWAHRALVLRELKGLADHISADFVHPVMGDDGWTFATDPAGATGDRLMGSRFLREVYLVADPHANTRVTVPVLWDKRRETIVSNESSEIIRMLNAAFDGITGNTDDYYPAPLRTEIDTLNDRIYKTVNNGVYKAGFATTQDAYDAAVRPLFETLDWLEDRLTRQRYLAGDQLTEADVRLVTTLFRFDLVYHGHFKCNRRRIVEYHNLWAFTRDLYQHPSVAKTVNFDHISRHYHQSHETINLHGIVPIGPDLDWTEPHRREKTPTARSAELAGA